MGENKNISMLFLDGNPLCNTTSKITIDSLDEPENGLRIFKPLKEVSISGRFRFCKMSRKKFIRCLRKLGYSKKQAKHIAWYHNNKKISYGKAYDLILFGGNKYLFESTDFPMEKYYGRYCSIK